MILIFFLINVTKMEKKLGHTKVKVVVRVRPPLSANSETCVQVTGNKVSIQNHRNKEENLQYEFSSVFNQSASQSDIFNHCVQPLLGSTLEGHNVSIFAYGPTGAGKTHTMLGVMSDPGIIPRVVKSLFTLIEDKVQKNQSSGQEQGQYMVTFSYMEIYNEKVQDLLSGKQDLPIREDSNRNLFVAGISEKTITNFDTFRSHFEPASCNRTVAATHLNEYSSRSHSILLLKVSSRLQSKQFTGKIYLVDLAGSEDNRRTGNKGIRLKESGAINKSLFVLGEVVDAINHNLPRIPYRNSKLTRLLQDSIGGSCQSVMITNIAPEPHYYYNTYCTLNFATKSKKIVNLATQSVKEDSQTNTVKPTAAIKPCKRRSSLIPVADGKRPRTSLSSQVDLTASVKMIDMFNLALPSPIIRKQNNLMLQMEQKLQAVDKVLEDLKMSAMNQENLSSALSVRPRTRRSTFDYSLSSKMTRRRSSNLGLSDLAATRRCRRSSSTGLSSPDVVFATPNYNEKLSRLVDVTNKQPQPIQTKPGRLQLKKPPKVQTPHHNPLVDQLTPTQHKGKKRRNSDLTPLSLGQKIAKSTALLEKQDQNQRDSSFLALLNSASIKQLQELRTVGVKRAKAIYEWRQVYGHFNSIDELKQIPGFTDKTLQNMLTSNLVTLLPRRSP